MKEFGLQVSLSLFLALGLWTGYLVLAQEPSDIVFPVKELGGCENEQACRAYCDAPENMEQCVAFAEKHNLISAEDAARAKAVLEVGTGPGGCRGQQSCEAYCEDISHLEECLSFAEQHNLMPQEELEEARRVAKALSEGAQLPGGCRSRGECEAYCEDATHLDECLDFGEKAGFMSAEELGEARKVAQALKSGAQLPGNCRTKDQCDAYCAEPSNMEECFNFALAAGFISPEEAEEAKRILPLMMSGQMPGNCKSKEECESYCADDTHMDECVAFAEKAGLMSTEELEMYRKTGGKGPGDCRSKESCDAFCNDPANQETCFNFAKEHGLIPEEDLRRMEEGLTQMREGLEMAPPEVQSCLESALGNDTIERIRAGTLLPNPEIGDQMRTCFEQFMPAPPAGGQPGGEQFEGGEPRTGPGGCASQEECMNYCSDPSHQEECARFRGGEGMPSPEQMQEIIQQERPNIPEEFQGEFQEEYQQRYQEEYQRQYEEQMRQQIQEQIPQPFQEPVQQEQPQEPQQFIAPETPPPPPTPEVQGAAFRAFQRFLQLFQKP